MCYDSHMQAILFRYSFMFFLEKWIKAEGDTNVPLLVTPVWNTLHLSGFQLLENYPHPTHPMTPYWRTPSWALSQSPGLRTHRGAPFTHRVSIRWNINLVLLSDFRVTPVVRLCHLPPGRTAHDAPCGELPSSVSVFPNRFFASSTQFICLL